LHGLSELRDPDLRGSNLRPWSSPSTTSGRPRAGGAEDAPGYYREALALADELGMRPLVAHCHLGLGKLYGRTGKRQEAQEHLTTAATMYGEVDMGFWLEQAQAGPRGPG
jgi:hypothetical protein